MERETSFSNHRSMYEMAVAKAKIVMIGKKLNARWIK